MHILPACISEKIIERAMINELLTENPVLSDERIVVLGEKKINQSFYRRLKKNKIGAVKCVDREKLDTILKRNKKAIISRRYLFIITGKDYGKWIDVLDSNGIPASRYAVFPLFSVREIVDFVHSLSKA